MKVKLFLIPILTAFIIGCNNETESKEPNSTYTLKANAYTLLKGESATLEVVREDGTVMAASDCQFTDSAGVVLSSASGLTVSDGQVKYSPADTGIFSLKASCTQNGKSCESRNLIHIQCVGTKVAQIKREPWFWKNPEGSHAADDTVGTPSPLLYDNGTTSDENKDETFTLDFPAETSRYGRVILQYTKGGALNGPGQWDQSVQFFVKDKTSGQWYQILSAITPYGGQFKSTWTKVFYLDVTEFLPMLSGATEFRYFAGEKTESDRCHTGDLKFLFYKEIPTRQTVWYAKVYDSGHNPSMSGRGWRYGVESLNFESDEHMGLRTFTVPADVKEVELRFSVTGHGSDKGYYPNRPDFQSGGCAEFDRNFYYFKLNGNLLTDVKGVIWYNNHINNYQQGGTSFISRSNWGPGLPVNVQYWAIKEIPASRVLTLDIDFEPFVSTSGGYSQYIVSVDLYGYK